MNRLALQVLDGLDWRTIPRFSDEQVAQIRSAGGSLGSEYDRKREQQQVEWLKSKNLR